MANSNSLKQRLRQGDVVFGPWCTIPSGPLMNITASAGFDFVIVDMEHSVISFETSEEMIRAAQSVGVSTLVRLGDINEEYILKSLDLGAAGVITAHIETGDDAAKVVSHSKYFPSGKRGFSPYTRAGGYSGGDIKEHAVRQNQETIVGVILEGRQGIDNIDDILNTDQLDLVYIGAYDLSQAIGRPGEVTHPEVRRTLDKCVAKIRGAGLAAGGYVAKNAEDMAWMIETGMQFITYLPDCAVIQNTMQKAVMDFQQIYGEKRG